MKLFDYEKWETEIPALSDQYQKARPFPHVAVDNFLESQDLDEALAEFPTPNSEEWINYRHVNSKKFGKTDRATMPATIGRIIDELNTPRFVEFIGKLTGIPGLFPDPSLEGGGMHQSVRGGYLNVHADFTVHTFHQNWKRRVNIIVYLNKNWDDSYGGHLELWEKDMSKMVEKVAPIFNRVVIFNTDPDAYHGHPLPLNCPEGLSRKSLALYYYTRETEPILVKSTEYRARPEDPVLKRAFIYLDKMALRTYDFLRRKFGISDKFISRMINIFSKPKR